MRNRQLGVSLLGLIVGAVILIFILLLGMKTLPPWLDYFAAKKLIVQIAQEQRNGSVVTSAGRGSSRLRSTTSTT